MSFTINLKSLFSKSIFANASFETTTYNDISGTVHSSNPLV